jgi:hypothetical protein
MFSQWFWRFYFDAPILRLSCPVIIPQYNIEFLIYLTVYVTSNVTQACRHFSIIYVRVRLRVFVQLRFRILIFSPLEWILSSNLSKLISSQNLPVLNRDTHEGRIYKTIILPVVLYGCETWSLTLREEHRLRVFENRVLGRIFGPKWDEVTGEWRKLHNKELHDLYSSPSIIRIIN